MNASLARALVQDAFYQVLDNKVFRLLVILVIGLVAPWWFISIREKEISLFWGLQTLSYDQLFQFLGWEATNVRHLNVVVIQRLQSIFVERLSGSLGIIACVAATAFFVPRMLEKGAADTLFSKPVSRLTLLLARYFSGILFAGALATILIVGMHLGFLVVSGYSDPGFLWGIVTIIYLYAIVHSFSVSVGVLTRSSAAAILTSIAFYSFTGLVHSPLWINKEYSKEVLRLQSMAEGVEEGVALSADDVPTFLRWLARAVDVAHFVLPKTTDADFITRSLRRALEGRPNALEDEGGMLVVEERPEGFEPLFTSPQNDLSKTTVAWVCRDAKGEETARIEARRYSRDPSEQPETGRRARRLSHNGEANKLLKELQARDVDDATKYNRNEAPYGVTVSWTEGDRSRMTAFFTRGDWIFVVDGTFESSWQGDDPNGVFEDHVAQYVFTSDSALYNRPKAWYEKNFGWTAPLRFNAFFSIGSTLAFVVAVLFIAWLFLRRIDF